MSGKTMNRFTWIKSAGLALLLCSGTAGSAPAQSTTSDLVSGGVGVSSNGSGFDGTLGDPDLYIGSSMAPISRPGAAPAYGAPSGYTAPGISPGPTYPPPPMEDRLGNPYREGR